MDATTLGSLLAGAGGIVGAVVVYLGKRGENANTRLNSEIDQIQEERDGLRHQVAAKDMRIADLLELRLNDQVEIARLRVKIYESGETP